MSAMTLNDVCQRGHSSLEVCPLGTEEINEIGENT